MTIPPDFLDDLRNRVAVSDVVRPHVQLRKQGREWAGLSPFNKEKTPSFFVNDDKRFYHCFSSGKHGDVFTFLMDVAGLNFREAVESVAAIAGMDVPAENQETAARRHAAKGVRETLAIATEYFESQLRMPVGREAMEYLRGRGLDDLTIRRFRLGYSPSAQGSLAAGLGSDGIGQAQLVDAGLMKMRDDGRVTDYFRDRIMFPITDRQGAVIAFGGRALGDGQPKYLNSPETAVFQKSRVLYGLAQAREAAHKAGRVFVVEGYMDVIALSQSGLAEAVAPLGTAMGEDQFRLLWTLSAEPTLCLDGDRAGRAAAIRAAERSLAVLQPGRSLRFAALPAGEDPDTLVRKYGPDAMTGLTESSESLESVIWHAVWERHQPTTPERRAAFHRAIMDQVGRISDETVRAYYEQSVRGRLREAFFGPVPQSPAAPRQERTRGKWGYSPGPSVPAVRRRADPQRLRLQRQRTLLGILALHPALIAEFAEAVAGLTFSDRMLDILRERILSVGVSALALDVQTMAAQVLEHQSLTDEDDSLRGLYEHARDSAAAVLQNGSAEEDKALLDARHAAQGLVQHLEQDSVRADIAGMIGNLNETPETLDRIEASVAAERGRAPTDY